MLTNWGIAREYFSDDLVAYMERVSGQKWPTCLVRFMTYREGPDGTGKMRPRYNQPLKPIKPNRVRNPDRAPWTREQLLARVMAMAVAGRKRDLAAAEEEIRRRRDVAKYQREFADRQEEHA